MTEKFWFTVYYTRNTCRRYTLDAEVFFTCSWGGWEKLVQSTERSLVL